MEYSKVQLHQSLKNELKKIEERGNSKINENDCLIIKTANAFIEEARNRPIPNMLFSELWYENELCILFADTNLGKSILAVQIAQSVSSGIPINGFKISSEPKKTLYLDFELSDKQFEKRYSKNYKNHFHFDENFFRGELNPDSEIPKQFKSLEDFICDEIADLVSAKNIQVIIIDNITYLNSDNEKSKDALKLMKKLKRLTKVINLSILVLAHTPKRDESKPISKNDLAGSKMLINFCDSSFAIGNSKENSIRRYIKQIKQRNTEHIYHGENVIVCDIVQDFNFLKFDFVDFDCEKNHLKNFSSNDLDDRDTAMIKLIEEGLSNVEIGKRLGIHESTVRKRKEKLFI